MIIFLPSFVWESAATVKLLNSFLFSLCNASPGTFISFFPFPALCDYSVYVVGWSDSSSNRSYNPPINPLARRRQLLKVLIISHCDWWWSFVYYSLLISSSQELRDGGGGDGRRRNLWDWCNLRSHENLQMKSIHVSAMNWCLPSFWDSIH